MHLLFPLLSLAHAEDLAVSSNIKGLSIVINGEDTGKKTPSVIHDLEPGMVSVQVGDNCRAGEAMVEVGSGANKVSVHAEEALATLTVQVTPAQAVVDVNSGKVKLSPNVPVGLPCGTYEITASLKGYEPTGYTLELIGGQELTLPIELDKLGMSTVEVSVSPRSASILFDGREVGKDAVSLPSVYQGVHTLGAEAKGYADVEVPIVVGDGDDLVFKIALGRGDMDGDVQAVGGAGKVALQAGAKAKPKSTAKKSKSDEEIEDLPEELVDEPEEEPEPVKPAKKRKPEPEPELDEPSEPDEPDAEEPEESEEPDEELAPAKSWSELHAEQVAREKEELAEKPKKNAREEEEEDLDAPEKPKGSKAGLKAAGGVLLGVGAVVGGGGGIYAWTQANEAYATWQTKQAAADGATSGDKRHLQEVADTYWTEEFASRGNLMYGLFAGGGALAATGVVLLVIDADGAPIVLPTPGGAMVGWTSAF